MSRPNVVGPPAASDVPYAGRVIIETTALREQAGEFDSTWTRRLIIIGATAKITYDDDRAVVDVYRPQPVSLDWLAHLLVDPGGWQIDRHHADGELITWLPPVAGCACSGRVRVSYDAHMLCEMADERDYEVTRGGARTRLRGRLRWRARMPNGDSKVIEPPQDRGNCPNGGVWPDSVMFRLPVGMPPDLSMAVVLALAGGSLPDAPRIASVAPAGDTR